MSNAGDLFDQYAAAYEDALTNAISVSGEGREFFHPRRELLRRVRREQKQFGILART